MPKLNIVVVGAGPAGLTAAIALAKRGHEITVLEREKEITQDLARSYPVDISGHGMNALAYIDALSEMKEHCCLFEGISLPARNIKSPCKNVGFLGSRTDIVLGLISCANKYKNLKIIYGIKVETENINISTGEITIDGKSDKYDLIIGADGAGSPVRKAIVKTGDITIKRHNRHFWLKTGVLDKKCVFEPDWLHTLSFWPFTVASTVPNDNKGIIVYDWSYPPVHTAPYQVRIWLGDIHPELNNMISDSEAENFLKRKPYYVGKALECNQFHSNNCKSVLIGDAAHPFPPIGQGINISLESAQVLSEALQKNDDNLKKAIPEFTEKHKPDAEAVIAMGLWSKNRGMRAEMATMCGLLPEHPLHMAKDGQIPYREVYAKAKFAERILISVLLLIFSGLIYYFVTGGHYILITILLFFGITVFFEGILPVSAIEFVEFAQFKLFYVIMFLFGFVMKLMGVAPPGGLDKKVK